MSSPSCWKRQSPIVTPAPRPSDEPATVIFIHGANSFGEWFASDPPNHRAIAYNIHQSPDLQHVKVVIPHGLPSIWPSIPFNLWYNIGKAVPWPENETDVDEFGIYGSNQDDMKASMDYFEALIADEVASGTSAHRITLIGYSQGASIVALFLLTRRRAADLAAVISFAGFSPIPLEDISRMQQENGLDFPWRKKTKLFMLHGASDTLFPVSRFHAWRKAIDRFGHNGHRFASMEWRLIEGLKHAISRPIWPHIREILKQVVPINLVKIRPKL